MMGLRVTDLKQWAYCPRIVYYQQTMPGSGKPTYKMEEAVRAQELIERLEMRRALGRYGLDGAVRRFGVWLSSPELGLSGKIDLLLEGAGSSGVVDFKLTSGLPGENHRLQLAGYALLAERSLGLRVDHGFLYRIPDNEVFQWAVTREDRERVVDVMEAIRRSCEGELLPAATSVRKRCEECEYANYCGDVW